MRVPEGIKGEVVYQGKVSFPEDYENCYDLCRGVHFDFRANDGKMDGKGFLTHQKSFFARNNYMLRIIRVGK